MRHAVVLLAFTLVAGTALPLTAQLPRLSPARTLRGPALGSVEAIAVGADGAVVVADGGNDRIYRFTPAGQLRDSLGRSGAGPGEFRAVAGLAIGPRGEVALADIGLRRVTVWRADGKVAGTAVLASGTPLAMSGWENGPTVIMTDFAGSLSRMRIDDAFTPRSSWKLSLSVLPDPMCIQCPMVGIGRGQVVMAGTRDSSYQLIQVDSSGKVMRRWTRPAVQPRARTNSEVDELMRRVSLGPGGGARNPEGRAPAPERERFRYPPRILAIERDGAGRVWVQANHAGMGPTVFDVFSADGKFAGDVRVAEKVERFAIGGSHLVASGLDENDEPIVWTYRIVP